MHIHIKAILVVALIIVSLIVVVAKVSAFDKYQHHQACLHSPQYQVHMITCP